MYDAQDYLRFRIAGARLRDSLNQPHESTRKGCPCECNSGGFCGGCGHAGCGGRR